MSAYNTSSPPNANPNPLFLPLAPGSLLPATARRGECRVSASSAHSARPSCSLLPPATQQSWLAPAAAAAPLPRLLLLLVAVAAALQATVVAPPVASGFIRKSCRATQYPSVCEHSLAAYGGSPPPRGLARGPRSGSVRVCGPPVRLPVRIR
jgi:hypothetical protein